MAAGSQRAGKRSPGAMIRASSFGDISRAARQDGQRIASKPEEQIPEPQGHRRGSSVGSTTRPRRSAQQGAKSQGHAATATSWNDLATLSPQVLLDRFTKGVEKGRSWWDNGKEALCMPESAHSKEVRKPTEEASHCRGNEEAPYMPPLCNSEKDVLENRSEGKEDAQCPPEAPVCDGKAEPAPAPPEAEAIERSAGKRGYREGGCVGPTAATDKAERLKSFKENRDVFSKHSNGFAGQQSDLKSRVSRREAEALLQRLTAGPALGQDLDEVRRLRKLVDDRSA